MDGDGMSTHSIFQGPEYDCERLIGCLQYCAFAPNHPRDEAICDLLRMGTPYQGMLDLRDLNAMDQLFYIIQKFPEFGDR